MVCQIAKRRSTLAWWSIKIGSKAEYSFLAAVSMLRRVVENSKSIEGVNLRKLEMLT